MYVPGPQEYGEPGAVANISFFLSESYLCFYWIFSHCRSVLFLFLILMANVYLASIIL